MHIMPSNALPRRRVSKPRLNGPARKSRLPFTAARKEVLHENEPTPLSPPPSSTTTIALSGPTRLLELPPELRLNVYHQLFAELFGPHQAAMPRSHVYRLPQLPQSHDFSRYTLLVRLSKLIHNEAVPLFEAHYLPNINLHLSSVEELRDLSRSVVGLGQAYRSIAFTLTTTCELFSHKYHAQNANLLVFINRFTDLPVDRGYVHSFGPISSDQESWHECDDCGIKLHVFKQGKAGVYACHYRTNVPGVEIVANKIEGEKGSLYVEMRGRLCDLCEEDWGEGESVPSKGVGAF